MFSVLVMDCSEQVAVELVILFWVLVIDVSEQIAV